ncbi:MAG: hypothetical protein R6X15_09740 [Pseudomonadota bacterium]
MIKKSIIGVLAVLGAFFIFTQVYIGVVADCHSVIKGELVSPDKKYEVRYINKICKEEPRSIEVWVGVAGSNRSTLAFKAIVSTTTQLRLKWENSYTLNILYPDTLNPTVTNHDIDDVSLKFSAFHDAGT